MTNRSRQPGPSPDRWLISYADFITLMFGFFVILYSVAQLDRAKPKDVSESVKRAFHGVETAVQAKPVTLGALAETLDANTDRHRTLAPSYADLKRQLQQEIAEGKMQVSMDSRGIVISLHEKSFFPSGGDAIRLLSPAWQRLRPWSATSLTPCCSKVTLIRFQSIIRGSAAIGISRPLAALPCWSILSPVMEYPPNVSPLLAMPITCRSPATTRTKAGRKTGVWT